MSTILVTATAGGTITPCGSLTVLAGADASFSLTPLLGYHVADLLVDGTSQLESLLLAHPLLAQGIAASWTFADLPTGAHTVAVSFAADTASIAEQIIAVALSRLAATEGRPSGMPTLERERVFDLERPNLPAMILTAYQETPAEGEGRDTAPLDGVEELLLTLHFDLYAQAGGGLTSTQATDAMARWIVARLCGPANQASPFHDLADLIRRGTRISQLFKGATPYCWTQFELHAEMRHLSQDMTRRG